eukprot:1189099-Prorocentrum_minimum.AAC.1
MATEPVTKQTAAIAWDKSRRPRQDFLSVAMDEVVGQSGRARAANRYPSSIGIYLTTPAPRLPVRRHGRGRRAVGASESRK